MEKAYELDGTVKIEFTYNGRSFIVGVAESGTIDCLISLKCDEVDGASPLVWFDGKPYLEYFAGESSITEAADKCRWLIDHMPMCPRKKRKNRSRYKKHLNTIRVALEELTEYSEELTPEQLRMGAAELREELEKLDAEHRKSIAALRKK